MSRRRYQNVPSAILNNRVSRTIVCTNRKLLIIKIRGTNRLAREVRIKFLSISIGIARFYGATIVRLRRVSYIKEEFNNTFIHDNKNNIRFSFVYTATARYIMESAAAAVSRDYNVFE